jgi:hypothetical protein
LTNFYESKEKNADTPKLEESDENIDYRGQLTEQFLLNEISKNEFKSNYGQNYMKI